VFDLTLLPFYLRESQEQSDHPGLYAVNPPRRAARGRSGDQMIILFHMVGNAPLSASGLQQLLSRLSETYFQTSGSVTSALRTVADTLNQYLLERNLRNTSTGRQGIGLLNLAIVHGSGLYLANGGPTHSILLSEAGVQHWHDPQSGSRGLGLSRTAPLRFFQAEIQPGSRLLLISEMPATLRVDSLQGGLNLNLDLLRRRLLTPLPAALSAGLIQFQAGAGNIKRAQPLSSSTAQPLSSLDLTDPVSQSAPQAVEPAGSPQAAAVPDLQLPSTDLSTPEPAPAAENPGLQAAVPPAATELRKDDLAAALENQPLVNETAPQPAAVQPPGLPVSRPRTPSQAGPGQPAADPGQSDVLRQEAPAPRQAARERSASAPRPRKSSLPLLQALSSILHGERRLRENSGRAFSTFVQRILPGKSGEPSSLSSGTMAFIAIAVPLVIVVTALVIYNEIGRRQFYQDYFTLAVQAALQTQDQTDPAVLRNAWGQTITYLDKADQAQPDQEEAIALRQQAQQAMDGLDAVARVPFQPAIIGGLSSSVSIGQMIATSNDLYLLNTSQGRVIRAVLTGDGYEVDPNFVCGPGPSGSAMIGNLVDMVSPPRGNEFNASLLAIDDTGNLLFCTPGGPPTSYPLVPPDNNWGKIQAMIVDANGLYVLDTLNNAVWVYTGPVGYHDPPHLFFGKEVPTVSHAVDLAVNGDDMLLLHADGHLTFCTITYVGGYDTRCTDPAPYSDPRPGQQPSATVISNTLFSQLQYTQPPDPSYYMLDPISGSIYHFSLRLNLQRQIRTLAPPFYNFPARDATSFAVSPNRLAFIAFDNQVFYSQMP